jgi:hypothetical protein
MLMRDDRIQLHTTKIETAVEQRKPAINIIAISIIYNPEQNLMIVSIVLLECKTGMCQKSYELLFFAAVV